MVAARQQQAVRPLHAVARRPKAMHGLVDRADSGQAIGRRVGQQNGVGTGLGDTAAAMVGLQRPPETLVGVDKERHVGHRGDALGHSRVLVDRQQLQIGDSGIRTREVTAGQHDHLEPIDLGGLRRIAIEYLRNIVQFTIIEIFAQFFLCHTDSPCCHI